MINNKHLELINNNSYLLKKKQKKEDKYKKYSLCFLLKKDILISQSICIKLGCSLESLLTDICNSNPNLKNIKGKNIKGKKERDIIFIDKNKKIIYYFEVKSNINLDTEKSKSTYIKILKIKDEIEEEYPDYMIKWGLINTRYLIKEHIDNYLYQKYLPIKDNIFGINDIISIMNKEYIFKNYKEYTEFLKTICNKLMSD